MTINFVGISLKTPRPAAFGLHKLIVSGYRKKQEKRQRDRVTAEAILQFCKSRPEEWNLVSELLKQMPSGWRKRIRQSLYELDSPLLNDVAW